MSSLKKSTIFRKHETEFSHLPPKLRGLVRSSCGASLKRPQAETRHFRGIVARARREERKNKEKKRKKKIGKSVEERPEYHLGTRRPFTSGAS